MHEKKKNQGKEADISWCILYSVYVHVYCLLPGKHEKGNQNNKGEQTKCIDGKRLCIGCVNQWHKSSDFPSCHFEDEVAK